MRVLALFLRVLIFATTLEFCIARVCLKEFGVGINTQHCEEAMKSFDALMSYAIRGGRANDEQWFSRTPTLVGTFHHLPKAFVFGTCSIGIDITDHPQHGPPPDGTGVKATWGIFARELRLLMDSCVVKFGWGGLAKYQNFEFIILHPQGGISQGTCLTPHQPAGMSLSRCVEKQILAKQQILHQAGLQSAAHLALPGAHGAQQLPSQPQMPDALGAYQQPSQSQIPNPRGPQRQPLFDAQAHGASRPLAVRPPTGAFQLYQGEQATHIIIQQHAQRFAEQQALDANQRALDLAQQHSDRRAQRQAFSGQQPRAQMPQQQRPFSPQASQALNGPPHLPPLASQGPAAAQSPRPNSASGSASGSADFRHQVGGRNWHPQSPES